MTNNTELIERLRGDSRDYGRSKGYGRPVEPGELLVWDQREKRAWKAAEVIEKMEETKS